MTLKEYYELAVRNEFTDLYVLIMFLVYEKKALSFEDTKDKLEYYLQDRFRIAMNRYLTEYKEKLNINYKPSVFEIQIEPKGYKTVYVLAVNEKQATSFCFSQMYNPIDIKICDLDLNMTKFNQKNEEINVTIRELRDQTKQIPSLLGGY